MPLDNIPPARFIPQSDEAAWLAARLGKLTASRISDALAKIKTGWGASRANYLAELVAERLTGAPGERYVSPAMQWGLETEEAARRAYEFYRDVSMSPAGFVDHPRIAMSGASPDGFIGDDGLWECKCPNTATHIDTLLRGDAPAKYRDQMQWQMACTDRKWVDFSSFDPRLPERMQLFVVRVYRNDAVIAELERDAATFLAEVEATVAALERRCG